MGPPPTGTRIIRRDLPEVSAESDCENSKKRPSGVSTGWGQESGFDTRNVVSEVCTFCWKRPKLPWGSREGRGTDCLLTRRRAICSILRPARSQNFPNFHQEAEVWQCEQNRSYEPANTRSVYRPQSYLSSFD